MPTDTDKKLNGTPEPFRRPVVWGRPPATIFRAGPLPKGGGLPPLPEAPRMQFTPGILSGSMIPRAAPSRPQFQTPAAVPTVAGASQPLAEPTPPLPAVAPKPDLTVRPLPGSAPEPAPSPEPVRAPAPVQPVMVATDAPASPAPVHGVAAKPANRVPLYAGVALAALTVLAVGAWISTRSPAETPAPAVAAAPAPAVPVAEPVLPGSAPVPGPTTEAAAEAPAPVVVPPVARPAVTPTAPARTPPAASRPASPAPEIVAPPPVVITAPLIEIAPAPVRGPEPTEAERPSTDPDAPIATRPQPLG